jgi:hypothetical protein
MPAACGGTGFQPVHPHRQDAGATKNFLSQSVGRAVPAINRSIIATGGQCPPYT